MGYLAYGVKPGVGPVLKVMKYSGDDYLTVPNNAYSRFYFNSENQNLSYMNQEYFFGVGFNKSSYPSNNLFVITGSSPTTATRAIHSISQADRFVWYELFSRLPGQDIIPIFESKLVAPNGRVSILKIVSTTGVDGRFCYSRAYSSINAYVTPDATGVGGTEGGFRYAHPSLGFTGWCGKIVTSAPYSGDLDSSNNLRAVISHWDLPANRADIPNPTATPVSGQEVFRANPTQFVLARRGFTVDGSSGRQRIIDSDRRPIMCIMYGETPAIAAGGSLFAAKTTDFNLTETMFVDTILSIDGLDYAMPSVDINIAGTGRSADVEYQISAGGITFYNAGSYPVRIKYMIYGTSADAYTTGGNQIMRPVENGNVQIKRPGSSDTAPNSKDVLLDTRYPSVQIIKEAWIPWSDFTFAQSLHPRYGLRGSKVDFGGTGLFVFPKVICNFPEIMTQGYHELVRSPGGSNWQATNQSCVTILKADSMTIHISPGAPTTINASTGGFYTNLPDPVGVRYYVLGIATLA